MDLLLLLAALVAIGLRVCNDPPQPLVALPDPDVVLLRTVERLAALDLWAVTESARIAAEEQQPWWAQ